MDSTAQSIKKIDIGELRPGMYIADLSVGWMDHPFLLNSFAVDDEKTVKKIAAAGIRAVYIDTARGDDVPDAPTREQVTRQLHEEMTQIASSPAPLQHVPHKVESARAVRVRDEAHRITQGILNDARLGRQVDVERLRPVVQEMTESILRNGNALISLCRVKDKDDYTFLHSVSVCALLVAFCRASGMDRSTIELAGIGGLLHDIGKMKVANDILNKPGKLTDSEFQQMKDHVVAGMTILNDTPGIAPLAIEVAQQHHERHDGSGYPRGLAGDAISRLGQMAAVCDVYDALTSNRCYHQGMPAHEALRKIFEWSQYHFNPEVAQQFIRVIGIYPVGTLVRLESGRIGVVHDQHEGGNLLQPVVLLIYDSQRLCFLTPAILDLAKPLGHGGGDRIVGYENPEKWGIRMQDYL